MLLYKPVLIPVLSFFYIAPGGFKLRVSGVPSSTLLPLHADILASLFTPEGQPYLLEVIQKGKLRILRPEM